MERKKYRLFLLMLLFGIVALLGTEVRFLLDRGEEATKAVMQTDPMKAPYYETSVGGTIISSEDEMKAVVPEGVKTVFMSGQPVGIYVKTKGVMVISTGAVEQAEGILASPCDQILQKGDYIQKINGMEIKDKTELTRVVSESNGKELLVGVIRNGVYMEFPITPVQSKIGDYMLGLWVKDDISGIGTLTFADGNQFYALGHSINDNDTGIRFQISDGVIFEPRLLQIVKPEHDTPGRIEGMIDYQADYVIGRVEHNNQNGIVGKLLQTKEENWCSVQVPIGNKQDVHKGRAYIYSAIAGTPQYYEVEILTSGERQCDGQAVIELKIVDSKLLGLTAGIIQGMSGSPIIQDGKLIGAVTHVFVDDPTRGYAIFIEEMLVDN